jgi:hypothetical protein
MSATYKIRLVAAGFIARVFRIWNVLDKIAV